jgi:uncharacterized protein (TIGR02145 family)
MKKYLWFVAVSAFLFSCADDTRDNPYDERAVNYVDLRYTGSYGSLLYEGQTYKTVKIGTQTWMAENLNYNASGSKCYDCDKYGRLYNWATVMSLPSSCNSNSSSSQIQSKHRGICPSGWHIPSEAEWNTLSSYVKSDSDCSNGCARLLEATSGWNSGGKGIDRYGFSALPGGYGISSGSFGDVGNYGYWWSASEYEDERYECRFRIYYGIDGLGYAFEDNSNLNIFNGWCHQDNTHYSGYSTTASFLFSVRCVKD